MQRTFSRDCKVEMVRLCQLPGKSPAAVGYHTQSPINSIATQIQTLAQFTITSGDNRCELRAYALEEFRHGRPSFGFLDVHPREMFHDG